MFTVAQTPDNEIPQDGLSKNFNLYVDISVRIPAVDGSNYLEFHIPRIKTRYSNEHGESDCRAALDDIVEELTDFWSSQRCGFDQMSSSAIVNSIKGFLEK